MSTIPIAPTQEHTFSFFAKPVRNTQPSAQVDLRSVHDYLRGAHQPAVKATLGLHALIDSQAPKTDVRCYKSQHFDYVTFSALCRDGRSARHVEHHSSLLCVDIDGLADTSAVTRVRRQLRDDQSLRASLIFTSPSRLGVKAVYAIDLAAATHDQWYRHIEHYLAQTHAIVIDPSCKDVTRPCYLCYDPQAWLADDWALRVATLSVEHIAEREKPPVERKSPIAPSHRRSFPAFPPRPVPDSLAQALDAAQRVRQSGLDPTAHYAHWVSIGLALAHAFGEAGRGIFHTVSSNNMAYTPAECDAKYDQLVAHADGRIGLGTFYALIRQAGITLFTSKNPIL